MCQTSLNDQLKSISGWVGTRRRTCQRQRQTGDAAAGLCRVLAPCSQYHLYQHQLQERQAAIDLGRTAHHVGKDGLGGVQRRCIDVSDLKLCVALCCCCHSQQFIAAKQQAGLELWSGLLARLIGPLGCQRTHPLRSCSTSTRPSGGRDRIHGIRPVVAAYCPPRCTSALGRQWLLLQW